MDCPAGSNVLLWYWTLLFRVHLSDDVIILCCRGHTRVVIPHPLWFLISPKPKEPLPHKYHLTLCMSQLDCEYEATSRGVWSPRKNYEELTRCLIDLADFAASLGGTWSRTYTPRCLNLRRLEIGLMRLLSSVLLFACAPLHS